MSNSTVESEPIKVIAGVAGFRAPSASDVASDDPIRTLYNILVWSSGITGFLGIVLLLYSFFNWRGRGMLSETESPLNPHKMPIPPDFSHVLFFGCLAAAARVLTLIRWWYQAELWETPISETGVVFLPILEGIVAVLAFTKLGLYLIRVVNAHRRKVLRDSYIERHRAQFQVNFRQPANEVHAVDAPPREEALEEDEEFILDEAKLQVNSRVQWFMLSLRRSVLRNWTEVLFSICVVCFAVLTRCLQLSAWILLRGRVQNQIIVLTENDKYVTCATADILMANIDILRNGLLPAGGLMAIAPMMAMLALTSQSHLQGSNFDRETINRMRYEAVAFGVLLTLHTVPVVQACIYFFWLLYRSYCSPVLLAFGLPDAMDEGTVFACCTYFALCTEVIQVLVLPASCVVRLASGVGGGRPDTAQYYAFRELQIDQTAKRTTIGR